MKTYHFRRLAKMVSIAAGIAAPGTSWAAALTFDGNPDYANNTAVNGSYGSNISSNSTEFVTTDTLGAAPNVGLTWPAGTQFEFHGDTRWQAIEDVSGASLETHVLQVNSPTTSGKTITFTPDPGFAVIFEAVDYGYGTGIGGGTAVGIVKIFRDFDDSEVLSVTTSTSLAGGQAERLDLSFTGVIGESYTLEFTSDTGTNWGAIDDLSFGQEAIPEPSSTLFLGFGGLLLTLRRRS